MTIGISKPYPHDLKTPSLILSEKDYVTATSKALKGYGRYIIDANNPPPIEQLPYVDPDPRSWRTPDEGTGINQAVIQGNFSSCYKSTSQSVEATNLAVKSKKAENADYTIGWESETDSDAVRVVEFNNHKDAGQQFLLKKGSAALFLLGSTPEGTCPNRLAPMQVHPDNIDPITDLIVVCLKKGEALEVGPGVYHQPLYPINKIDEVMAYSIQGSIHNCTTCDFVNELGFDVSLRLKEPLDTRANDTLIRFIQNYAYFILSAGTTHQDQIDSLEKKKRHSLFVNIQEKIKNNDFLFGIREGTPLSLHEIRELTNAPTIQTDAAFLCYLINARIKWLYSTGRFLLKGNTPYLYASDSLALSYLLNLYKISDKLASGIEASSQLFLLSKSPYERILIQKEQYRMNEALLSD